MSYANMLVYLRTLPDYSAKAEKKKKKGGKSGGGDEPKEIINADDPANKAKVEQILFGGNG